MIEHDVYTRLKDLGIELPATGAPAAAYVMSAQSGNVVYLSGHIAKPVSYTHLTLPTICSV